MQKIEKIVRNSEEKSEETYFFLSLASLLEFV